MLVQSFSSPKFVIGGGKGVLDSEPDQGDSGGTYSRARTARSRGSSTPGSAKLLLKISHSQGNVSSPGVLNPLYPENRSELGVLSAGPLQFTSAAHEFGAQPSANTLHLTAASNAPGHSCLTGGALLQHGIQFDHRLGSADILPSINSCRVNSGKSVSSVHSIKLNTVQDILKSAPGVSGGGTAKRIPSATQLRLQALLCNTQPPTARPVSSRFTITHADVPKASNLLQKLRISTCHHDDDSGAPGTRGFLQDEVNMARTVLQREDSGYSEPLSNKSADTEEVSSTTGSRKSRPRSRRKRRREKSSKLRQGLKVIGSKAPNKSNQIKFSPRNSETVTNNKSSTAPSPRGAKGRATPNFQVYCKPIQTLPPSYRPPKPEKPAVIRQSDLKSQNLLTFGYATTVYRSTGSSNTLSFSLSKSWGSAQSGGGSPGSSPRKSFTTDQNQTSKTVKIYLSEKQSENMVESGVVVPCAPPTSPTPEHLLTHTFIPSMSDNVAQRAMKGRLEVLEKKQKKKEQQKEVEKDKLMKQLLKEKEKEMKRKQRQEIYALNKVMTQLEYSNFLEFCKMRGITIETESEDSNEKKHSGKRRKKSAKKSTA